MQIQFKLLANAIRRFDIQVKSVVEAGARDCRESLDFRATYPNAEIIAFECDPNCIPVCKENIRGTKIKLIEKAVSDSTGEAEFHVSPESGSSSLLGSIYSTANKTTVPMTRLIDELAEAPTVLWLDAEGGELGILKGCGEMIRDVSIVNTCTSSICFKSRKIISE